MFFLELYFLFYRVPRMMTRLARERGRSALGWSLLGIGAWVGAELVVLLGAGFLYGIGEAIFGWPMPIPTGFKALAYVLSLVAALLSATLISRILMRTPTEKHFPVPPPPPEFSREPERVD
ncbi:MAG TPA: hypothetical protein VK557_00275 [Pyrinomonadaceae bacterium]|nr:hypothetical protein [Pyrinomonadaceae bacterium]